MADARVFQFDLGAEVDRYFDASSVAGGEDPRIVLLMGGIASGKTTIRKQQFSTGYVVVDAAEVFLNLSRGEFFPFPGPLEPGMNAVGQLVAHRAVSERRHIVTELTAVEYDPTKELLDTMKAAGYVLSIQGVTCDMEEAWRRNVSRGNDNVSCHFAEPYHRRWLLDAAYAALTPRDAV